ncbi:periplasmic heavy metal sensor [Alcaligenaceae bacterium CGII-47]|nr:periplasmic heavy metal sensor [Alcaligenaceae bacterium CGII-47]
MTPNTWKRLLAISLALNIGFAATVTYKQWQNTRVSTQASISLPEQLGLSPTQREHWQRIEQGFITDLKTNWDHIRVGRKALIDEIFSTHPDRTRIDAIQADIAALQSAQQQRVIAQLLAERELLDVTQQAALKALLLSRHAEPVIEEEQLHKDH